MTIPSISEIQSSRAFGKGLGSRPSFPDPAFGNSRGGSDSGPSSEDRFALRDPGGPHEVSDGPRTIASHNPRNAEGDEVLRLLASRSEDEWLALAAQKSLRAFCSRMFTDYTRSAHIDLLTSALERAVETPDYRLIVTMPPRHSKSVHVSEHLPAWFLGRFPDRRVMQVSHTAELAFTFSRRVRNKILDPRWPFPRVTVAGDKSAVKAWDISGRLGGYLAVGVGGSPAGHGANLIVIDDPIGSIAVAESEASREALWEWYQGTIRDRLEPGGSMVVTSTRWHEEDLTGHLLSEMRSGGEIWHHLHLPALRASFRPSSQDPFAPSGKGGPASGSQNPRTYEDPTKLEALWPERWPVSSLLQVKKAVGSRVWEARFQGRPSPMEGGLLQRSWWHFYRSPPARLSGHLISADMSFRETKEGSFVVLQVWACLGADRYLLDQSRFRADFPAALAAFRAFCKKWPQARTKLVENKANGPAIVASLRHEVSGINEVNPVGGKLARASAISAQVESGNVYLPDPEFHPWVYDFIEECASFPHGSHDDQVDAMSQALARLEITNPPSLHDTQLLPPSQPFSRLNRLGGLRRSSSSSLVVSGALRFFNRRLRQ